MSLPKEVQRLIEIFDEHIEAYRSGQYNEAQLRNEFLNPFFKALGWDMDNTQGLAEAYKDVVHEDAIRIGGAVKAPDYCFRIGGTRKFFLEAKKPSVDIGQETSAAFQLRRYAWSAKLPLSILSDFDEFAVYDCRIKPKRADSASTARVFFCRYQDYADKWDWIASIFSKDAILKGSFDKFADENKAKRGTAEVDDDFLATIERWRSELARNLALRNPRLSQRELNFAVQRIIDRIIFLRICEDRGIELYGRLLGLTNGPNIYGRLGEVFEDADAKYNSGLFYFHPEKGRHEPADELTLGLDIDDKLLRSLLRELYYPESPYEFTVISSDILGQAYEQFLGKVIRLTEGHRAVVENKPEVKKAGGVYYTPTYIVDYIVKETVGKLVEGKTPKQVAKLRVLDPACGSGSFLINAYQFLLDWHHQYYSAHEPARWVRGKNPVLVQTTVGWKLTISERKRILLDNIYGVDIDPQAVEVTKLSLLLKVLEGENEQTIQPFLRLFQQRALPDLGENIKCGNSLIGPEEIRKLELSLLREADQFRINAFAWDTEFPKIMASGGFDVVIGNPPYIRIQTMKEWAPTEVDLFRRAYRSASSGNYDIYVVFIEKGLRILNEYGRLGFILPHKFFSAQYGRATREIIAERGYLSHIVHFGDQQVFEHATTYTCLLFLLKEGSKKCQFSSVDNLSDWRLTRLSADRNIAVGNITRAEWDFSVGKGADLFEKLNILPKRLCDYAHNIFQGIVSSCDSVYFLDPLTVEQNGLIKVKSPGTKKEYLLEIAVVPLLCKGSRDVRRYIATPSKRVLFPYDVAASVEKGRAVLIPQEVFAERFPRAWRYLEENKDTLSNREGGKMRKESWYGYVYPKSISLLSKRKILTPSIAPKASFTLDDEGNLYFVGSGGGGGGGYGIILESQCPLSYEYILGLLNSRLLDFFLKKISSPFRGGYFSYNRQYIERLPICDINFSDSGAVSRYDKIGALVKNMLKSTRQLQFARTPHEREAFQRQIDSSDNEIDQLVYQLYGLTEDDVRIVEEATSPAGS
jgi:hypothetical protein